MIKEKVIDVKFCIFWIAVILFFVVVLFFCLLEVSTQKVVNPSSLLNEEVMPWGVKRINAPVLWEEGITGENVKVAVLDTGVDFNHPDLKKVLQKGYNTINPAALPVDDNGHGTLTTGIIAAQHNQVGIMGVAPGVQLYPVKVLDEFGEGEILNVIQGIDWCIENKIDVINISFSIMKNDKKLENAIQKAINSGIIIVASGSNSHGGEVGYPAAYEDVVSVTSVNNRLSVGKSSPKGKIDFSSPGVDVVSTALNGEYEVTTGTSFSAPYVTGIICLLLQENTDLDRKKIKIVLKEYAIDLGPFGKDSIYGEGIVVLK
ncbi:S8 family peptidase [Paenibacillus jiagnxiensis]|uniref:S8 family peptidase n=1 Tax=Paenibacillus jiagnxiensis TaxID=3228926 RepID=UPI0033A2A484